MRAAWIAAVLALAGCSIEPIDIANRECDEEHACAAEYTCIDNICERTDSLGDGE